jgi:hypothetical protein
MFCDTYLAQADTIVVVVFFRVATNSTFHWEPIAKKVSSLVPPSCVSDSWAGCSGRARLCVSRFGDLRADWFIGLAPSLKGLLLVQVTPQDGQLHFDGLPLVTEHTQRPIHASGRVAPWFFHCAVSYKFPRHPMHRCCLIYVGLCTHLCA